MTSSTRPPRRRDLPMGLGMGIGKWEWGKEVRLLLRNLRESHWICIDSQKNEMLIYLARASLAFSGLRLSYRVQEPIAPPQSSRFVGLAADVRNQELEPVVR